MTSKRRPKFLPTWPGYFLLFASGFFVADSLSNKISEQWDFIAIGVLALIAVADAKVAASRGPRPD
jgi:hypothetical protein